MKYYSEILKKVYDTEDSLKAAETEAKKKEEANVASKNKKALEEEIEAVIAKLNKAYDEYDKAKDEAATILDESSKKIDYLNKQITSELEDSNAKAEKLIEEANEKVKAATKEKHDAINRFNEKYGAYSKKYTGEEARKELDRQNNLFDSWFWDWFSSF